MSNQAATASVSVLFVTEARRLLSEEYLPKIERCLEQLNDEQIWWRANSQSNSIGNLLLHLCGNARQWIVSGIEGASDGRIRQEEFDQRDTIPRGELVALMKQTLREVDRVLAGFDHGRLLESYQIQGTTTTALEAIFHVTEHFSMHTGQIIMLTKMLAGRDMNFYDFSSGAPAHTWHTAQE